MLSAHSSWEHYRTHKLKGVFIFVYTKDHSTLTLECVNCWLYFDWYHTTRKGWLLELLPRTSSISTFDNRAALLAADAPITNCVSLAKFTSHFVLWFETADFLASFGMFPSHVKSKGIFRGSFVTNYVEFSINIAFMSLKMLI